MFFLEIQIQKWLNFLRLRRSTQLKWRRANNVTQVCFFVLFSCQRGPIESWIHTNQMSKCEHYVSDFFYIFVNFTLTLRLCTVSLPRPRPHFTDVQPTDGDYSDRWCAWSNLVSHLEQKAVCDYWSVLCCFNLFLTEVNFIWVVYFFVGIVFALRGAKGSFCSL